MDEGEKCWLVWFRGAPGQSYRQGRSYLRRLEALHSDSDQNVLQLGARFGAKASWGPCERCMPVQIWGLVQVSVPVAHFQASSFPRKALMMPTMCGFLLYNRDMVAMSLHASRRAGHATWSWLAWNDTKHFHIHE